MPTVGSKKTRAMNSLAWHPRFSAVEIRRESTAHVLRRHVGTKTLEQIVNELLEIRGDKDFRDSVERLVHALGITDR